MSNNKYDPVTEDIFRKVYEYKALPVKSTKQKIKVKCKPIHLLLTLIPILKWLPAYNVKKDLLYDIISGITVAVIHIPQGLAYALLAGVPPIVGIYMAVFPVMMYVIFGTSRHLSMGAFAVLCMMVGNTISEVTPLYTHHDNSTSPMYSALEIGTAISFMMGVWQLILGVFQLGVLSVLFSEPLVSGFTTGVSFQVLTSQVSSLFGIKIVKHVGSFQVLWTYYEIFKNIENSNIIVICMSIGFITVLSVYNELVKPIVSKKSIIPVPMELLAVVVGTVISYTLHLSEEFNVSIVGFIPTGVPHPKVPPLEVIPNIIVPSLVYAVVAIAMNISLAKLFARKLNYEIDSNQELLAYGAGCIFGSFFSCLPYASSLSRSVIQQTTGGRTQLTSVISLTILIFILLFIGPLFETLPHCVLASIVVVALKGLLFQIKDLPGIYRLSKLDGLVWIATFSFVVVIDLEYGLLIGISLTILSMLLRSQIPKVFVLGQVPKTNIYLDVEMYKSTEQVPNILILQIVGVVSFSNCDAIRKQILDKYLFFLESCVLKNNVAVVLDVVAVSHVDPSGVKSFVLLAKEFKSRGCDFYVCQCSVLVYNIMTHCKFFDSFSREHAFPTIHDAVEFIQHGSE